MFTPPPSPRPPSCALKHPHEQQLEAASHSQLHEDPEQQKKAVGRQTKWSILLVPFVLIAITASTRYFTHPAVFDLFTSGFSSTVNVAALHKRHGGGDLRRRDDAWQSDSSSGLAPTASGGAGNSGGSSGTVTGSASATPSTAPSTTSSPTSQPLPTILSNPPTLPTPFPQPFSAGIPTDNMSIGCLNFFNAMANAVSFRQCRPFSLLLQSSDEFITAQSNLTLSNTLVWGTCNVAPGKDRCAQTMTSYADQLRSSCPNELQSNVQPIASDTLIALEAYGLMYDAACTLVNPTANTYCFIEAAQNSNPSDLYFYQLPIGLTFPTNASPTCSTCSKDLLALYWSALGDNTQSPNLRTLATTYNSGAKAVDAVCNSDFAVTSSATSMMHEVRWSMALEHLLLPLVLGLWLTRTLL
ncbi:hypothetical protein JOM56_000446 [Amanita muscaria]